MINATHQRISTYLLATLLFCAYVSPATAQSSMVEFGFEDEVAWLSTSPVDVMGMGDALSCSINAACDSNWQDPARATVMIFRSGSSACSGVLLNNIEENGTPYILTAHHCGTPSVGETHDWTVRFGYESPTCGDPGVEPTYYEATGVTVVSASSTGDYALLRLDGEMPAGYTPFFAGWSIENVAPSSSVAISHPMQDLKKITYDDDPLQNYVSPAYWEANFDRGTIEGGSSGAPLFNPQQQVIGHVKSQMTGTSDSCVGDPGSNTARILFPKLWFIWSLGVEGQRVQDFLDPNDTGAQSMGGLVGEPGDPPPPPPSGSDLWVNEINADASNGTEFIELVAIEGLSLENHQVDIYECNAGATNLLRTEPLPSFTFPNDSQGFGFFLLAGTALSNPNVNATFTGDNVLADGSGLLIVRDAAGHDVFDYQYGNSTACPAGRTTRSGVDAPQEGTMGFTISRAPTSSDLAVNSLTASPGLSNNDGGQELPVELVAFEAVLDGSDVLLTWETASETNNAGFEIQLLRESALHEGAWEVRGWMDGYGTTVEAQQYRHRVSQLEPGLHRFRLKQIDYDGTFEYSPEVEIAIDLRQTHELTPAYPNPFTSETTFSLTVGQEQRVTVTVYDMLGRRVVMLHDEVLSASSTRSLRFEGRGLASGVYIVQVTGERFADRQMITLVQ